MKRHTWRSWGTLELRQLKEMRDDGLSATACAAELGRTVQSVRMRIQQEGWKRKGSVLLNRWLPEFQRPHQIDDLAERYGVTRWAVKGAKTKLRALGYVLPRALTCRA